MNISNNLKVYTPLYIPIYPSLFFYHLSFDTAPCSRCSTFK